MTIDLVMATLGALIGMALILGSSRLAAYTKEGDDHYREHPWVQSFEPSTGRLATDEGRVAAFRTYYVIAGVGFLGMAAALSARALLGF